MRILIPEEALETGTGHWPSYVGCIADGLRAAGDQVDVVIHERAVPGVIEQVGGVPWFSRNCWLDARSQGAAGGILHNFRFRSELREWLVKKPSYDWVCALTMRLQHLLAFALLSRDKGVPSATRFLLLFVQGFGEYAGTGNPSRFPLTGSNLIARFCFWLLRPAVRSGRVVLGAETRGMQEELGRFTGLPVSLFPHPVPAPPAPSDRDPATGDPITITITCPGFARHEKGNDLLQDAVLAILAEPGCRQFHFVMQWPGRFALPDGSLLGPDSRLEGDSRVQFLNDSLDAEAYEALLARSDFAILPYRRNSYHHRVSRVAIEAASRGIPLIYTSGTWTREVAELAQSGFEIREETGESVKEAIEEVVCRRSELRRAAVDGAERVACYHSASQFRKQLEMSRRS